MMGKRLSLKEINIARHEQEVWNSMVKRGAIDTTEFVRTHYVVCGCGAEGCGFITGWRKSDPWNGTTEQQQELYRKWLQNNAGKQ